MSCCNGWKMSNSATSERNAPTRNAAPPAAGMHQASLLKPVVVILEASALSESRVLYLKGNTKIEDKLKAIWSTL